MTCSSHQQRLTRWILFGTRKGLWLTTAPRAWNRGGAAPQGKAAQQTKNGVHSPSLLKDGKELESLGSSCDCVCVCAMHIISATSDL